MPLDDKQFGEICLQLLEASSVPGNQLDVAISYREMAKALIAGAVRIENAKHNHQ